MSNEDEFGDIPVINPEELRLVNINLFLTEGHIWPHNIPNDHPIKIALAEVLRRLPEDDFYQATCDVQIIIESMEMLGVSVPFGRTYPQAHLIRFKRDLTVALHTIVIFERSLKFSSRALVALVAHEIAHIFENEDEYGKSERVTNDLVVRWGFEKELRQLEEEKKLLRQESGIIIQKQQDERPSTKV